MTSETGDANDTGLRTRAEKGDAAALAEFFSVHRPRLWRMVDFWLDPRLRTRLDPDDILQESYLNAAQRLPHLAANRAMSFLVWIRAVVRQTFLDAYRRHFGARQRDARRDIQLGGGGAPLATSTTLALQLMGSLTSPSQAAMRAELHGRLQEAIERMDALDREVLALRHFEELTNAETAEVLGIQPKAASMRYIRALGRLKEILAELPGFASGASSGA